MLYFVDVCESSFILKIILFMKSILGIVFFVVPIILIVMVSIDVFKIVINMENDKVGSNNIIFKRIFMAIVIFLIPTIVGAFLSLLEDNSFDYSLCLANANSEYIKKVEEEEEYERLLNKYKIVNVNVNDIDIVRKNLVNSFRASSEERGKLVVSVALQEIKDNPVGGAKRYNSKDGAWCSEFAAWCIKQAAEKGYINKDAVEWFDNSGEGVDQFKDKNLFKKGGYCPRAGDIIFFDWEGDGSTDHTGLVESCDGNKVYTIEGNVGGKNKRQTHDINSSKIYGYGTPNY